MDSDDIRGELDKSLEGGGAGQFVRFLMACVSGAVPVFGGVVGGAGSAWSEFQQEKLNKLFHAWLGFQQQELIEIGTTLMEVMMRLDDSDERIKARLESAAYLSILRKCFREWSAAESEEKRRLIRNLLVMAAQPDRLTADDMIKLYIKWIDDYSEEHFKVIADVFKHPGSTRAEMWTRIHGGHPRDDSLEADLFKLLIHDLSTGRVMRQHRETNAYGQFIKQRAGRKPPSRVMVSAFEDGKEYELTSLGKDFVRFTMTDLVPQLPRESAPGPDPETP